MRISSWSKAVVYPWWITTICAITTKRYVRNYWYIKSIRHEVLSCTLICIGFNLKTNCVCFKSKCCLDCFQISRPFQLVQLCLQVNLLRQMLITQQRLLSSEKRNCEALKWELNVAGVGIEEQKGNDKEFHVIWYATRMVLSIYWTFRFSLLEFLCSRYHREGQNCNCCKYGRRCSAITTGFWKWRR